MDLQFGQSSQNLFSTIAIQCNEILKKSSLSLSSACLMIQVQFLQLVMILMDIPLLELPTSISTVLFYFNSVVPHKMISKYDSTKIYIILMTTFLFQILLIGGFFVSLKFKRVSKITEFYCLLVYLFEYNLILPSTGCLLNYFVVPNDLSKSSSLIISIVFIFLAFVNFLLLAFFQLFFFNFFIKSKDPFARTPSKHFVFQNFTFLGLLLMDLFLSRTNNVGIHGVFHLVFSVYLIFDFLIRLPYSNYAVTLSYLYAILVYFWIILVRSIGIILNFLLFKSNMIILWTLGMFFILLDLSCYREFLQNLFLRTEFEHLDNPNYIEKKIRLFLQLIKNSKKEKADELRLASLIHFHIDHCKDDFCLCRNPNLAYNSFKEMSANVDLPIFKDLIMTKSIFFSMIYKFNEKIRTSSQLSMVYISFLLEETNNLPLCGVECAIFDRSFGKSFNLFDKICLLRIKHTLTKYMKEFNSKNGPNRQKYEEIVYYDTNLESLTFFKK